MKKFVITTYSRYSLFVCLFVVRHVCLFDHILPFFVKIRDDVTQRSLIAKRQLDLKDMIIEDEVPDIGYVNLHTEM